MVVVPFTLDHHRALLGEENINAGIINQISGPAFALVEDGVVLAAGGVRVAGIGQAWAILGPDAAHKTKSVVQAARSVLDEAIVGEKLYRVYAEATVDKPAWFKHMGFHQQNNLFVR